MQRRSIYLDDGLAVIHGSTPAENERTQKHLLKLFNDEFKLKITADANLKTINFLDITLDIANGTFKPYRKPGDSTIYINVELNHPPPVIKEVPKSICKRIFTLSVYKDTFDSAIPPYQKALSESGFKYKCSYQEKTCNKKPKKCRKRNIIMVQPTIFHEHSHQYRQRIFQNTGSPFPTIISLKQNL